ncbi:MAG: Smr/MutS family protein, partial [Desulfovibrio sp.]|nr:Smr/MutS family protein [Desulfovibrio sp.]
GIIKDRVQGWLTRDPFKRVVLAFCTALPKHGGAGAIYVLLRKFNKTKGKIVWERTIWDEDV